MTENYQEIIDSSIEEVITNMKNSGGEFDAAKLQPVMRQVRELMMYNQDAPVNRILDVLIEDYLQLNEKMVEQDLTPGISSSIKILGGPEVNVYRGYTDITEDKKPIDENTRFDLASITKIFTALTLLKDSELNLIDLNKKVREIDPSFNLNVSLNELLRFYHEIRTPGRIDEDGMTKEQAIERLQNATVSRSGIHLYSDIPYMIAKLITNEADEKFNQYFVQDLNLKQTGYEVASDDMITGGSLQQGLDLVHDPKARIIDHAGHAGVYSTSKDLNKLFEGLATLNFINMDSIKEMIRPIIKEDYVVQATNKNPDGENVPVTRGMLYKKHPLGLQKTEVLPMESDISMAISGMTGTWFNMDFENGVSANILTNPFSGNGRGKDYPWTLDKLKETQFDAILKIKMVQKIYEKLYGKTDEFNVNITK